MFLIAFMVSNFQDKEKKKLENRLKKLKSLRKEAKVNNRKSILLLSEGMIEEMEVMLKEWDSK